MADRIDARGRYDGARKSLKLLAGVALLCIASTGPAQTMPAGRTIAESGKPGWPDMVRPAADAPNILLIMTDDVGFGASSTFGGPVETPTFDALAKDGLRYSQMTTTGICSPTRAALLTGRNHNAVNVGNVMDAATGYEGYTSVIPKSAATVAKLLGDAGYGTAMFGKGHITPLWETGPTGPFDRWPTGLGFQYFYGFLGGDTNQWAPALYQNNVAIEPPADDPNYILDRDLADQSIAWIRKQHSAAPGKPLFVYYAPGTAHAPHHAPREWMEKYRGRFDAGWDAARVETLKKQIALGIAPAGTRLAARPAAIPAWASLTAQQKRVYAREMEAYAAALSFADHEIGRVIAEMRREVGDNLMVIYLQGDNGSSAEGGIDGTLNEHGLFNALNPSLAAIDRDLDKIGGPMAANTYSMGWAFAMNAPFPWVKQVVSHFGATRNGMVLNWPGHVGAGIRPQFHHVTDIAPTILEAAHVTPPASVDGVAQQPFDGVSLSYSFADAATPSHRRTQYYEIWDNMAIYQDGWVAASIPVNFPWEFKARNMKPTTIDGRRWQLFDVAHDFSESTDLAGKYPAKLEALKQSFFAEAARNKALPVHRYEGGANRPSPIAGLTDFHYAGPVTRIPEDVAPHLAGHSFTLSADVTIGEKGAGTLLALGGRFGGMAWYLDAGRPAFHYNLANLDRTSIVAPEALAAGQHKIELRFDRAAGENAAADVTLIADGKPVATGHVPRTIDYRFSLDEAFDVGADTGTPVTESYAAPNHFNGVLSRLDIHIAK